MPLARSAAPMSLPQTLKPARYSDRGFPPEISHRLRYWHVLSSTDIVHCTECGACLSVKNFSRASGDPYGGQCVYRDGKFYWYVPMTHKSDSLSNGSIAIGVAVATSPTGPITDAIGEALITNEMTADQTHSWDDPDPIVFTHDDGQAYLCWGSKSCNHVKLKANVIEVPRNCQ
jgi:beta-xylosidase